MALELLGRAARGGEVLVCDKGYARRESAAQAGELDVTVVRPRRLDEPGEGLRLAPIRQRIESIIRTCEHPLMLERDRA